MADNPIKLVNENGRIVGKDHQTGDTIPVEFDSLSTDQLSISGQWHDIRDYGAVGDGTTDNTQDIIDAILAAESNGGDVIIPPGDYYYSSQIELTGISDLTIRGYGASSILRHDDVTANGFLFEGATEDVIIEGIRHIGNASTGQKQQGMEILGDASGNVPKRVIVRNCIHEDWGGDAIVWTGMDTDPKAEDISAIGNFVTNCGDDGINPGSNTGAKGGIVSRNLITDPNDRMVDGVHLSINAENVVVENNRIVGTDYGVGIYEAARNTIRSNQIEDVRSDGIATKSGTGSNNYENKIVDNTIVSPGSRGINLIHGEGHEVKRNTVDGGNRGVYTSVAKVQITSNEVHNPSDYGIVVSTAGTSSNSKVSNNTVYGTVNNSGIFLDTQACTVVGNVLTAASGITENGGDYNTIQDNIARGGVSTVGSNTKEGGNIVP